jgi:glycosyltransferase involved in cell wall biosynthesis
VSVLLCTRNGAERLPPTVSAILAQEDPLVPWEVLLVDNGSTDGSSSVVRSAWPDPFPAPLRVLDHAEPGIAGARMAGLAACRGELVVFVDDDNHLAPDYLAEAVRFMGGHPDGAMAGGVSDPAPALPLPPWFPRLSSYFAVGRKGDEPRALSRLGDLPWGAGAVVRKEALDRLLRRGWKPLVEGAVPGSEDTELFLAFLLSGWELWYTPSLRMVHDFDPLRLRWDDLRRLARSKGMRWAELHPYFAGRTGGDRPRHARWSYQVWQTLRKQARPARVVRYLAAMVLRTEGDAEVIWAETAIGTLLGLWRTRAGYRERAEAVRSAPWRVARRHDTGRTRGGQVPPWTG